MGVDKAGRDGVTCRLAEDGEGGEVCRVALLLYGRLACFGIVLVASWRADMGANGARPALVGESHARWLETHTDDGRGTRRVVGPDEMTRRTVQAET